MSKQKKPSVFEQPKQTGAVVGGRNVFTNDKGQDILYDKKTGNGYLIQERDRGSFNLYQNRFALAIAIFMLAVNFLGNWILVGAICIAFAIVLEIRYRTKFLPSLTRITNFKPKDKKTLVQALADTNNKSRCILLCVLYLALGILMVINGYQINASLPMLIGDYAVLVFTTYMAIIYFKAVRLMDKQ